MSDFLYKNPLKRVFCPSFPLDPVLYHDHQRLVVQICNWTIRTEVDFQQMYWTFINCWTWNRVQLNKFTTNSEFIDSNITCLFGPEMMDDILCGCISYDRRFPSFLVHFAWPKLNTAQMWCKFQERLGCPAKSPTSAKEEFQRPIYVYFCVRARMNLELSVYRYRAFVINPYIFQICMSYTTRLLEVASFKFDDFEARFTCFFFTFPTYFMTSR